MAGNSRRTLVKAVYLSLGVALACLSAHAAPPQRIASIGGTVTEIICTLGAQDQIVGVDTSSVYPDEVTELPQVGYARQLSAEGILSLNPDLVLATEDAGPPAVIDQLEKLGVRVETVTARHTLEGATDRIRAVGRLIGREETAEALAKKVDSKTREMSAEPASPSPRVLFIYARAGGVMNVAGTETGADEIIRLAGGVNAMKGFDGYRPLTAEAAVAAAPDVILLTDRGLQTGGGLDGVLAQPGLALTPAGQSKRVVSMDDLLLLGFGPRLDEAVAELRSLLGNTPSDLAGTP
jgi:iron complex transport system substrate-binding protein